VQRSFLKKFIAFKILDKGIQGTEISRVGRTAYALYDPGPYSGDTIIFRAKQRFWYVDWDPVKGWEKYIHGQITIIDVDGTHGLVYKPPYVSGLASAVARFLK
jgi:thioesterase domain-containing protein